MKKVLYALLAVLILAAVLAALRFSGVFRKSVPEAEDLPAPVETVAVSAEEGSDEKQDVPEPTPESTPEPTPEPSPMISMLLVLAVLVVLDEYNPAMGFLNSNVAKIFYAVLCAVGLFTAVCLAWQDS